MVAKAQKQTQQQVQLTTNYDQFSPLLGNRKVDELAVQHLMESMEINDLFTPILVNEKFEVVDGQHRLEARKRLNLIVPYIVAPDYGLAEVQRLNAGQRNWSVNDFTQSYIDRGFSDYEVYRWFRQYYKMPHIVSIALLMGDSVSNHNLSQIFNTGKLRVKDIDGAKQKAEMFKLVAPYFDGSNSRSFILALLSVSTKKTFNFKRFLDRLARNPTTMRHCATMNQYIELIEQVYNYRMKVKISLRYSD